MESRSELQFLKEKIKQEVLITKDANLGEGSLEESVSWLFDLRNITLQPRTLGIIAREFWRQNADLHSCQIGGLETASIPIIAALVLEGEKNGKDVSGFYIRKSRKKSGLFKNIEGTLNDKPVVLVDDLINSGSSIMRQILLLENEGIPVRDVFTVVRFRELSEYPEILSRNIKISSIFTLPDFSINFQKKKDSEEGIFRFEKYFKTGSGSYLDVVPKSDPILYNGKIIWTTDNGHIWCLSPETLEPLWHLKVGLFTKQHFFTTPFIKNDILYAFSKAGTVFEVNLLKGKVEYRQSIAESIVANPLVLTENIVIVCSAEGLRSSLVAYDFLQRKVIWSYKTKAPVLGTGAVIDGSFVVLDERGTFYIGDMSGVTSTFLCGAEKIVTKGHVEPRSGTKDVAWATMDGRIFVTNLKNQKTELVFEVDAGIYNKVLVSGSKVFVGSLDKNVYAIDMVSKKLLWKFETKGRIFSSPVIRNGLLFIGANDNFLYALNLETGEMVDRYQVTERITSPITKVGEGALLLTTFANELYKLSIQ